MRSNRQWCSWDCYSLGRVGVARGHYTNYTGGLQYGDAWEDRTWMRILCDVRTGCWNWMGGTRRAGYGSWHYNGVERPAHRIVYEWLVGPIAEGLELDHLCENRRCVRPEHLEPVTPEENKRRSQTRFCDRMISYFLHLVTNPHPL
jgi:hypothetical protein